MESDGLVGLWEGKALSWPLPGMVNEGTRLLGNLCAQFALFCSGCECISCSYSAEGGKIAKNDRKIICDAQAVSLQIQLLSANKAEGNDGILK